MKQTATVLLAGLDRETAGAVGAAAEALGHVPSLVADPYRLADEITRLQPRALVFQPTPGVERSLQPVRGQLDIPAAGRPRILLLAAAGAERLVEEALAIGVDDCLVCPCPPALLQHRLEALLRQEGEAQDTREGGEALSCLEQAADALTSSLPLSEAHFVLVRRLAHLVEVDRCALVQLSVDHRAGEVLASHDAPRLGRCLIDLGLYPERGRAARNLETVVIEDVHSSAVFDAVRSRIEGFGLASVLVEPIIFRERAVGLLALSCRGASRSFSAEDRLAARAFARLAALSLGRAPRAGLGPRQQPAEQRALPADLSDQIDDLLEELAP